MQEAKAHESGEQARGLTDGEIIRMRNRPCQPAFGGADGLRKRIFPLASFRRNGTGQCNRPCHGCSLSQPSRLPAIASHSDVSSRSGLSVPAGGLPHQHRPCPKFQQGLSLMDHGGTGRRLPLTQNIGSLPQVRRHKACRRKSLPAAPQRQPPSSSEAPPLRSSPDRAPRETSGEPPALCPPPRRIPALAIMPILTGIHPHIRKDRFYLGLHESGLQRRHGRDPARILRRQCRLRRMP